MVCPIDNFINKIHVPLAGSDNGDKMNNQIVADIIGHVLIQDAVTGEILLDKKNAVHPKNMARALARGLSNNLDPVDGTTSQHIYEIRLGNGGTTVNSLGELEFLPPVVEGDSATLYNETYAEIIDENVAGVPAENSVDYQVSPTDDTAIVICTATISASEPAGQASSDSDDSLTFENSFAFDELGLFTKRGEMLTHIIFAPIVKTANRELVITYTLTVSISS
jgi:hypothetical protein